MPDIFLSRLAELDPRRDMDPSHLAFYDVILDHQTWDTSVRARLRKLLGPNGTREDSFSIPIDVNHNRRVMLFFNRESIALNFNCYLRGKNGGVFHSVRHSDRWTIYFTPRVKITRGRHQNVSYWDAAWPHFHAIAKKYIGYYLRHFGHKARTLERAIVPMPELDGKSMCPGDGLKKAWREDTPKGVLKAAGLPTSKSMVKAMIAVIGRHHNELPNLSLIKMLYYISGNNVDVARAALLATCHVPFERPDIRLANCSIAMKALVSNFSKRERMDFINEVIDAARVRPPEEIDLRNRYHSTPGYVADIISMAKTVYKEHKAIPMPVRGMVRVHDELAVLESAIRNPELNNSIKYDKEVKAVDNAVLAGNSRIALPRTGTEIHSAGQQLHNCLAGYAPRAQRGDLMILFVKDFDGKLTGAMEIRNKKLIQLGGFANKVMDPFVSNAVWTTLHQAKIISEMPDVSNLDRVYYR